MGLIEITTHFVIVTKKGFEFIYELEKHIDKEVHKCSSGV